MTDKRLLRYNRSARVWLYLAVAAGFLAAVLRRGAGLPAERDRQSRLSYRARRSSAVLPLLADLACCLAFLRALIVWSGDVLAQRSASRLKGSLREDLTQQIFWRSARLTRAANAAANWSMPSWKAWKSSTITSPLINLRACLARLVPVFVLIVVFILDPLTTLVLLFTGPVLVLLLALIGSSVKDITQRRFLELSWMSAYFLDMLQGLATLKMFGRSRDADRDASAQISQRYGNTTLEVLRTAFQTGARAGMGQHHRHRARRRRDQSALDERRLPFDRALAVLDHHAGILPAAAPTGDSKYHAGTAGKAAADRIFAILDHRRPTRRACQPPDQRCLPDRTFASITSLSPTTAGSVRRCRISRCTFRTGRRSRWSARPARANPRWPICCCASSSRKADRSRSLERRLSEIDPAVWRSQVAWVPQQPHLFYGTIADNIRLAKPTATARRSDRRSHGRARA